MVTKLESEPKHSKKRKITRQIVEHATSLLATTDQAGSYAIQTGHRNLLEHNENIPQEMREIRKRYEALTIDEG